MAFKKRSEEELRAVAERMAAEFAKMDAAEGVCWLDAVENRAVQIGDAVATALMEEAVRQRDPTPVKATCPQCGNSGCYQGDRQRRMQTRRGEIEIAEAEYYCKSCRKSFFPTDA